MRADKTIPARRGGKAAALEAARDAYIKRNPDAVIATFRDGEMIIEKPVKEVPQKALPKPK